MGKLRSLRRMTMRDRVLFAEAAWWLAVARLAKGLLPYGRIKRYLSSTGEEAGPNGDAARAKVKAMGRAVTVMADHVPWQSLCLVQAMAARMMLRLRGVESSVYVGVARGEENGDLLSHAWLCSGDVFVTGEKGHERFEIITTFR